MENEYDFTIVKLNVKEKYDYSNKVWDWNQEHDDNHQLNGFQVSVYQRLLRNVDKNYGYAYPSLNQLAKSTGFSKNTVIKALKYLEKRGFIVRDKGFDGRCTRYYFVCLDEMGSGSWDELDCSQDEQLKQ